MRTLDSDVITELESSELTPFYVIKIGLEDFEQRYTDCDIPLKVSGEVYNPKGFSFEPARYSMNNIVDQLRVSIDNVDEVLKQVFVSETVQGTTIALKQVLLDSDRNVMSGEITLFEGEIDAWDLDETEVNITIASQFVQWAQQTLARHSASCRWKEFGGTECGYSGGSSWCDRSYARCKMLENTDNFGGFRFLPSLMDKEVWWGRTQA